MRALQHRDTTTLPFGQDGRRHLGIGWIGDDDERKALQNKAYLPKRTLASGARTPKVQMSGCQATLLLKYLGRRGEQDARATLAAKILHHGFDQGHVNSRSISIKLLLETPSMPVLMRVLPSSSSVHPSTGRHPYPNTPHFQSEHSNAHKDIT